MQILLDRMADAVSRAPRLVLVALGAITLVLGGFASQQQTDTDLTAFAPDSEIARSFDRVHDEFAAGGAQVQIIVDAGRGGDVLSADGLDAAAAVADAIRDDGDIRLAPADRGVRSFADPILGLFEVQGTAPSAATDDAISGAAATVLGSERGAQAAQLFSRDLSVEGGTARAGLVIVELDPALSESEAAEDELALAEQIDALDVEGVSIDAFSQVILSDQLQGEAQTETPRLLGLSLLLIVGILLFQYRSVSDVLLGFAGLIITIMWMFGIGVLLGPDFAGVVGAFTQMSTAVPVLLVGLGIDYAIHLTSRYREEQNHGVAPPRSSALAVRSVGGALVLATVTTMVGFLTNVFSPLPPMADFGVFTAIGVLSAFVVMALLVPAARHVLDLRPRGAAKVERRRSRAQAARGANGSAGSMGLSAVMGRTAAFAERIPRLTLGAALAVTVVAASAATQIETSFNQDDFIPEGSEPAEMLDKLDRLFGGDLSEQTYAILDGDVTDPAVLRAMGEAQEALASADHVRARGGEAQVTTPLTLLAQLATLDPAFAAEAEQLGFEVGRGLAPDADIDALFDLARQSAPGLAAQIIGPEGTSGLISVATTGGQEDAQAAAEAISAAVAPLREAGVETTVVSQFLVFDDVLDALTDSQTRGIAITLLAALALLVAYYGLSDRKPLLGAITMVPSIAVVAWILGTMVLLGINFNVLTAMVASIGIGIGVPYGIHVTHRFLEDRRRYDSVDDAIRETLTHTGGAMAGAAATTVAGFGVLGLSSLEPLRQFGIVVAVTILYSLLAAVLIQPACLKLWGQWRQRKGDVDVVRDHERRDVPTRSDTGTRQPEPVER